MAEYIEREAAVAFAQHAYNAWNLAMAAADGRREINMVYKRQELCKAVKSVFSEMPAADVAPVVHETPMLRYRPKRHEIYDEYGLNENGEMLYVKRTILDEKNYAMYCPACGKRLCSRFKNFCPNCGAKMDGGNP